MEKQFDVVDFIMAFEGGDISEADIVYGIQTMINDGSVWQLQGFYGRTAQSLIDEGFCMPQGKWSPTEAREAFEEYVAFHP